MKNGKKQEKSTISCPILGLNIREDNQEEKGIALIFMIELQGQIIGITWIEDIVDSNGKLGIYIATSENRSKGLGEQAVQLIVKKAFDDLGLEKIYLNVREKNERAINCYKKCGFTITKEYEKKHFSDGSYQGSFQMTKYK